MGLDVDGGPIDETNVVENVFEFNGEPSTMVANRRSPITGEWHSALMPISREEYNYWMQHPTPPIKPPMTREWIVFLKTGVVMQDMGFVLIRGHFEYISHGPFPPKSEY
jgi:hypothetical protein